MTKCWSFWVMHKNVKIAISWLQHHGHILCLLAACIPTADWCITEFSCKNRTFQGFVIYKAGEIQDILDVEHTIHMYTCNNIHSHLFTWISMFKDCIHFYAAIPGWVVCNLMKAFCPYTMQAQHLFHCVTHFHQTLHQYPMWIKHLKNVVGCIVNVKFNRKNK